MRAIGLTGGAARPVQFLLTVVRSVAILTLIQAAALAKPATSHAGSTSRAAPLTAATKSQSAAVAAAAAPAGAQVARPAERVAAQRLLTSASAARIPLPATRGPVTLEVNALEGVVRLRAPKDAKALAARLAGPVAMLCPSVVVREGTVEMTCRSRRLDGQLTSEGRARFLDLVELRGIPFREGPDQPPFIHYEPLRSGLGQACPGRGVVRGECKLKQGEVLEAAASFRSSLESRARALAAVRLGDLALRIGDPVTALGWYRRAGTVGVFGRVAVARACELDGKCLATPEAASRVFDPTGLPEMVRNEMVLRRARAEAYVGRLDSAVRILAAQFKSHGAVSICGNDTDLLCRRIVLQALKEAGEDLRIPDRRADSGPRNPSASAAPAVPGAEDDRAYWEELLETYLALPAWDQGPLAVELAQAAAPVASAAGAPLFGGHLLSALVPEVGEAALSRHLMLTAETYLGGRDWARARLIAEYAEARLGKTALADPRWSRVRQTLGLKADGDEVSPQLEKAIQGELAATLAELKESATARARVADLIAATRGAGAARGAEGASKDVATSGGNAPSHGGGGASGHAPSSGAAVAPAAAAAAGKRTPSGGGT